MNDAVPPSGWWLATDGKWYRPERHPQYRERLAKYAASSTAEVDTPCTEVDTPCAGPSPVAKSDDLTAYRGVPPGWYRDPADPTLARYWDGSKLSDERRPVLGSVEVPPRGRPASEERRARAVPWGSSPVSHGDGQPPSRGVGGTKPPFFSKDAIRKPWLVWVVGAVAAAAMIVVFVTKIGGGTPKVAASKVTSPLRATSTSVPSTTTLPPSTTTTVIVPRGLQPSADDAAGDLVTSWAVGSRSNALTVATPQAVATLFAVPYPQGLAIDRGCSTGSPPVTCTYGPPGGASPSDPIYSLVVAQAPSGGWYVSSAQILG